MFDPNSFFRRYLPLHALLLLLVVFAVLSPITANATTTQGFLFLPYDKFHRDTSSYSTDLSGTVYDGQSMTSVFGSNHYATNAFDAANAFSTKSPGITLSGVSWNPLASSQFFLVGAANDYNTTVEISPGYFKRWTNYGSGDYWYLSVAGWQIDTVIDGQSVVLGMYSHLPLPFSFNEVNFSVISRTDTGVYISYDLNVVPDSSDGVCSFVESPPGSGDYIPNDEDLDCTGLEEWPEPPAPVADGICPLIADPQNPFLVIPDPDDVDCQAVAADPDADVDLLYPDGSDPDIPPPVDLDGDGTPDMNVPDPSDPAVCILNCDNNGDGVVDTNIDNNGDGTPDINVKVPCGVGVPVNDVLGGCYINIDTDGDGVADINIDTNGDNIPDINIDTNSDNVPDVDVDVDGDGVPDENLDGNDDGIVDITTCTAVDENGDPDCTGWDKLRIRVQELMVEARSRFTVVFSQRDASLPTYTVDIQGNAYIPGQTFTFDFSQFSSVLSIIPVFLIGFASLIGVLIIMRSN